MERNEDGTFKKGVVTNPKGRQKGVKHELSQTFLADILKHWRDKGVKAIERTFEDRPEVYLKIVASLVPRDINLELEDDTVEALAKLTDMEAQARITALLTKAMERKIEAEGDAHPITEHGQVH